MRVPKSPPNLSTLIKALTSDGQAYLDGLKIVEKNGSFVDGSYLHWDELTHRPVPKGLDHKKWWGYIKLFRRTLYKSLPLIDKSKKEFKFAEIPAITRSLHQADLRAGGRIQTPDEITNPDTRDRYYVSSLIEEAITSSQLEGATTTHRIAEEMLRSGRDPRDKSERMILNNFVTMKYINELKDKPLTTAIVLDIHRRVTDQTLEQADQAGRLRKAEEEVYVKNLERDEILHIPPAAEQLPKRMQAMCDFANEKTPDGFLHPVLRAIILHFWLAYDHPFVDGNGRTARALFYWLLLRQGYWLFEFVSISRILRGAPAKYGRAFLFSETDDNDLTYFVIHQLDVIDHAIKDMETYLQTKVRETQLLERKLKGLTQLNHRQRALIAHALRHQKHLYTIESHRMSHNVVYQTARTDMLDLESRGLLWSEKIRRKQHFTPVADLEEKLRSMP